jgi:kinesin family protein 2/24
MKLLTDVDLPDSSIDCYVSKLSCLLSRKASGIVNLQTQLARFQQRLKEEGILRQNMD